MLRLPIISLLLALVARADVSPAPLFVDNLVLQRGKPVPVWGTAEPGEKVTVTFGSQNASTVAGQDRRWIVFLEALAPSNEGADLMIAGKSTAVVRNVVVGEVWLCSGQSNMEWPVRRAQNAEQEIATASNPLVRVIKITRTVAETPATAVKANGWRSAAPETVGGFTAVGYFFARELQPKLGLPIGIIDCTWGGTPVESWMSPAALASDPAFGVVDERWQQDLAKYPMEKPAHDAWLAEWRKGEAAAKAQGAAALREWRKRNPWRRAPRGPGDAGTPSGLFNGMINPLAPCALRGVLWYQGESNTDRPGEYRALFSALIAFWRAHFAQGDVPFYWVNLASFNPPEDLNGRSYAFLREAQTQALALPNTGQALAIDLGDPDDIHPTNKQEVARRLALLAKNRVYGIVVDDTGPTFAEATREGASLRVRFDRAAGGLIARDKPVQSLEIAGADRVFYPAAGKIERDTLLVSAPEVKEPVAVRYAWRNAPEANLYNGAGLPAVPFRSDDW